MGLRTIGGTTLTGERWPPRGGAILAVACAAQFLVVLDVSVVHVALPSMRRDREPRVSSATHGQAGWP